MSARLAANFAVGLEQGRRNYKSEKQADEDRAQNQAELEYVRKRRATNDARTDEAYQHDLDRRPVLEARDDATAAHTETQRGWEKEDREQGLADARTNRQRRDTEWAWRTEDRNAQQSDRTREIEAQRKKMTEEGMDKFVDALEAGADPNYAVNLFNRSGALKIKPGTVRFDKATGKVQFVDSDGEQFDGTVGQLRALYQGTEPQSTDPVKLGPDDRLVDPKSGRQIAGPMAGAPGAGGSGGLGGEKRSPFNFQTYTQRASDVVRETLGGRYDSSTNQWFIPNGTSDKVAFAVGLAGQVARHFDGNISAEEVGAMVSEIASKVPTYDEANEQARREVGSQGEQAVAKRRADIIRLGKVAAAQSLDEVILQQEQNLSLREASRQYPSGQEQGDSEAPPPNLLKEGFEQEFQDGSVWTLENGRAVRLR